jgi:hypothetical protein
MLNWEKQMCLLINMVVKTADMRAGFTATVSTPAMSLPGIQCIGFLYSGLNALHVIKLILFYQVF